MNPKTILMSGGTSGIGKGAVIQLLEEGFNVVTFSRDKQKCSLLQKELAQKYDAKHFLVLQGDVTDEKSAKKIVEKTIQTFTTIDILINNAGFGYWSACDTVDIASFQSMIQTNIVGVSILTKLVVPFMKNKKQGLILNIASIAGKIGYPQGEFYNATKFAVMGYSDAIRKELKEYGIKVSTVCPGMIKTAFFPKEELERRKKMKKGTLSLDPNTMLDVQDITRIISLICNQSSHCDIQDITVMPFLKKF